MQSHSCREGKAASVEPGPEASSVSMWAFSTTSASADPDMVWLSPSHMELLNDPPWCLPQTASLWWMHRLLVWPNLLATRLVWGFERSCPPICFLFRSSAVPLFLSCSTERGMPIVGHPLPHPVCTEVYYLCRFVVPAWQRCTRMERNERLGAGAGWLFRFAMSVAIVACCNCGVDWYQNNSMHFKGLLTVTMVIWDFDK